MKTTLKLFLPVIAAALVTSCSSDDNTVVDTQSPTIAVGEPHNEEEVAPGEELHIEAVFTDNVALASYKIEIHEDFDDHTHAINKSEHENNPWSYDEVFQIPAGQSSFEAIHHLDVPTEINGMSISEGAYHVGIYVTDTAGNEEQAFLEVHIEGGHSEDDGHDH